MKIKKDTKALTLRLDMETWRFLREIAFKRELSITAYMRSLIDKQKIKYEKKLTE